ncbi:MAG: PQQ-binding-like beta-propeller repeat protein, partial [Planctomycetes bacterium]|nr:PQQ-binding-like beta-propeller repeat protein [Planctomycetota bacterium]
MKTTGFLLVCVVAISSRTHAAEHWQQYGGDCLHNPVADSGVAPPLVQPRWTALPDFELTAASTPVVFDGSVYVYGLAYDWSASYVAAYSVADGSPVWQTPIDVGVQDSWSSPGIDPASRSVLIGSGQKIFALDADTGESNWTTDLGTVIFNSSVTIADGRAFISNSTAIATSSSADQGKLFALNLGATNDAPGAILWSAPLGVTSGCTPAYYA